MRRNKNCILLLQNCVVLKDYYYILGVSKEADEQDIKKAYRKLSIKFHPDKNGGDPFFEQRFKDIQEAYEVLTDPEKRSSYDMVVSDDEYIFDNVHQNFRGTPFAKSSKKEKFRITLMLSLGSMLLMLMSLSIMGVFDGNEQEVESPKQPAVSSLAALAPLTPVFREEPANPSFASKEKTEEWILTKLSMYTPKAIRERPAGVIWWDTVSGHVQKAHEYQLRNGFLVVSYQSVYSSKRSVSNKVMIPVMDISRVYSSHGKLYITTRHPSIIDDNLSDRYTLNSSVFSVQFDTGKEMMLVRNLSEAIHTLQRFYAPNSNTGNAQAMAR